MKARVDFFKPSGKWYEGCEIEMNDMYIYSEGLLDYVFNTQTCISISDKSQWTVVLSDTPTNDLDPEYRGFFKCVLQVGR